MTLPVCLARRTLDPVAELYYCRHPQVHAFRQLVGGPLCRSCRRHDDRVALRPFPPNSDVRAIGKTLEIVWAIRGEPPLGMQRLVRNTAGSHRIERLDEATEEALKQCAVRVLLHHIVDNFERLPDRLAFVPTLEERVAPEWLETLTSLTATHGFQSLGGTVAVECASSAPDVGPLFARLFDEPPPAYFAMQGEGGFVVSRSAIRRRPVSFYRALAAIVDEAPSAARFLERLWPYVFRYDPSIEPGSYGVVTAADGRYFDQLIILLHSLQQANAPPTLVFQSEFSAAQIGELLEMRNLVVRPFPPLDDALTPLRSEPKAVAWLKPWWLLHSPFDRSLWVDADCVVLKPLDLVFDAIAERPFVVVDPFPHFARNPEGLFDHPSLRLQVSEQVGVNSGVFGWERTRDRELLAAWAWAVELAAGDAALRQTVANQDQGLLIWALHRLGLHGHVRSDDGWNRLPDREFPILGAALRRGCSPLSALRERYRDVGILHWMAVPKLPELLQAEVLRSFAGQADKDIET